MRNGLTVSISCVIALCSANIALAMPDKAGAVGQMTQAHSETLSGKALQTMDSGGYTYVYIQKKSGDKVWVAGPITPVTAGSQVSFKGGMEMLNFESKSLKKKFDKIFFASAIVTDQPSGPVKTAAVSKGMGASSGSKGNIAPKDVKISVTKATGANAYSVQEIFSQSAKLDMKKVVVRGKVVKVFSGIMGKNWIHIQDGTGSEAQKNNDLVCTSQETAKEKDIVTVTGTLYKDKDFGSGYKYDAIIEGATFKK